jgi:hypothetical protein
LRIAKPAIIVTSAKVSVSSRQGYTVPSLHRDLAMNLGHTDLLYLLFETEAAS